MTIPADGIGMHLYTMRDVLAEDYPGTLKRLADIGYRTVGVSGRFDHSAAEIRGFADDAGLRIVLEHVGYARMADDWSTALDDVRTLGAQWIVVPSIPEAQRNLAGFKQAAAAFTEAGKAARDAGLKLLFHNHGFDFAEEDGTVLYDVLLDVDPELLGFELDLYWAVDGGHDPAKLFQDHPGRFPALHVKDMAADGSWEDVGAGKLDFAAMFAHAESGGVEQYLVEHDKPTDSWASAERSYRGLTEI
ncbi:sugar phosphate isomerase/epimerase [Kribbella sandramycini]|uniref:Sugar phosphate isomerase/epimerase n=1 Tax=Kribbella sandramycini TaxID=60450 RepID=A0A7Y4L0P7_9ACTN|nr:sugar phosphate isomerase/epimerase [Kribbella sandramycini]MBB6565870.1 sugar phosphate isomerase/epimerase [Kribbella sandramycini]NOL42134.1 sugar phosphate isomerase/epimerase [Kribbella sandramycini]